MWGKWHENWSSNEERIKVKFVIFKAELVHINFFVFTISLFFSNLEIKGFP